MSKRKLLGVHDIPAGAEIRLQPTTASVPSSYAFIISDGGANNKLLRYTSTIPADKLFLGASNPTLQSDSGDSKALKVKFGGNAGLQATSSGLGVKIESNKGLTVGSSGLATVIESNKGLTVGSSGLAAVADAAQSIELGSSGIGITLKSGNQGLQHDSGLALKLNGSSLPSLEIDSSGVGVKLASTSGQAISVGGTGLYLQNLSEAALASSVDMSSKVLLVATPNADAKAANKGYVDSVAQGLDLKESCDVATTAALTATYSNGSGDDGIGATLTNSASQAAFTLDGQSASSSPALAVGARVLVKNQSSAVQNGIYTITSMGSGSANWILTRATDFDAAADMDKGSFTFVERGTANADSGFVMTQDAAITVGTTGITWSQFSGAGQITAGVAMIKTGNVLDVSVPELTALGSASIHQTQDFFMMTDNGTHKKVTFSNLCDSLYADITSGDFTINAGGVGAIGTDKIKDTMIDWGASTGQVNSDDVPEGSSNKFYSAANRLGDVGMKEYTIAIDSSGEMDSTQSDSAVSAPVSSGDLAGYVELTIPSAYQSASSKKMHVQVWEGGFATDSVIQSAASFPVALQTGSGSYKLYVQADGLGASAGNFKIAVVFQTHGQAS